MRAEHPFSTHARVSLSHWVSRVKHKFKDSNSEAFNQARGPLSAGQFYLEPQHQAHSHKAHPDHVISGHTRRPRSERTCDTVLGPL